MSSMCKRSDMKPREFMRNQSSFCNSGGEGVKADEAWAFVQATRWQSKRRLLAASLLLWTELGVSQIGTGTGITIGGAQE